MLLEMNVVVEGGAVLRHRCSRCALGRVRAEVDFVDARAKCREAQGHEQLSFLSVAVINAGYPGRGRPW
jgi:hypothetical protein